MTSLPIVEIAPEVQATGLVLGLLAAEIDPTAAAGAPARTAALDRAGPGGTRRRVWATEPVALTC